MQRVSVDVAALPAELLPQIKAHLRVTHARDDALITAYIASAIGFLERKANISLNPAVYLVGLDELSLWKGYAWWAPSRTAWVLPLNNVREFVLLDAPPPDGVDVSDAYTLWSPDHGGNGTDMLVAGATGQCLPAAGLLTLTVGVDSADKLAPPVFTVVARITGSLYENREASDGLWSSTFLDEAIALWRPSA